MIIDRESKTKTASPESAAPIAVLGAGSWGTALAIQLARAGHSVRLWGHSAAHLAELEREQVNRRYLPDAAFPPTLGVCARLDAAVSNAGDVLIVVPSHAFRSMLEQVKPLLRPGMRVSWATKGFEMSSGLLPHQVAHAVLGSSWPMAVLSGPTFAKEVGAGLPTAMTVGSADKGFATALAHRLTAGNFRAYTSADIVGVETGGAIKNVLGIGAGIGDGLGYGANTRVALITRGLAELTRLGEALGAQRETFMGLAGLGDLVLTCTDNQSRNRRFGLLLAQGKPVEAALAEIGQVVEGYAAAKAVRAVARREKIDMPICAGVYSVLYENVSVKDVVRELMSRPIRSETD